MLYILEEFVYSFHILYLQLKPMSDALPVSIIYGCDSETLEASVAAVQKTKRC